MQYIKKYESSKIVNLDDNTNRIIDYLKTGKSVQAYHGTNRDYDIFSNKHIREWRAKSFLGNGIFLTSEWYIAAQYADANANSELPLSMIDDAKKISDDLYWFMHSLYYNGNITWENSRVKKLQANYQRNINGIDINDIANIVHKIPNNKAQQEFNEEDRKNGYGSGNRFINIFNQSSTALEGYMIEDIKKLGLGDYAPKVLTVEIQPTTNILISKNKSAIKNDNKHDIIIAYDITDLIDDVPEIIVKNINLMKIVDKEYVNYE